MSGPSLALEPTGSNRDKYDVQVRDEKGLTLIQRKLLVTMLEENNWRKACELNDVPPSYFRRLLQNDKAFLAAYNSLLGSIVTEAKGRMTSLLPKVGQVFEEGLDADRTVEVDVQCPECQHTFKAAVPIPHWAVKLRVAESLLKAHGMATQRFVHEGRVDVHNATLEDLIARALYQRGEEIPPDVEEGLRRRGLLEGGSNSLEGEYSEVLPGTEDESV